MTTLICTVCSEPQVITSRSLILPFVCDECQKAEELYNAMAPGAGTFAPQGPVAKYNSPKIEESDNHACDSATVENTTLLIEDLQNQLAMSQQEVKGLRMVFNDSQDAVERLRDTVENLLVKNFFKDEKISFLAKQNETRGIAGFQQAMKSLYDWAKGVDLARRYDNLREEFGYVTKRLFDLAGENGRLTHERDVWQKRAEIMRRCYHHASDGRRYYRGKLKDVGIKA